MDLADGLLTKVGPSSRDESSFLGLGRQEQKLANGLSGALGRQEILKTLGPLISANNFGTSRGNKETNYVIAKDSDVSYLNALTSNSKSKETFKGWSTSERGINGSNVTIYGGGKK